ncbi:MAG: divalent-cation tolerance protein CutA [Verrucomicrobiota bacterium]
MNDSSQPISIGWSTTPTRNDAESISHALVDKGLIACAQITGPVTSIYRWKGKVEDEEYRVIFKFASHKEGEVRDALQELHPYDVPQWIVTHADTGHPEYASWVHDSTFDDSP